MKNSTHIESGIQLTSRGDLRGGPDEECDEGIGSGVGSGVQEGDGRRGSQGGTWDGKVSCEVMTHGRGLVCNGPDAIGVGDARDSHGDNVPREWIT